MQGLRREESPARQISFAILVTLSFFGDGLGPAARTGAAISETCLDHRSHLSYQCPAPLAPAGRPVLRTGAGGRRCAGPGPHRRHRMVGRKPRSRGPPRRHQHGRTRRRTLRLRTYPRGVTRPGPSDAFSSVFTLQSPYADPSFRRRQDRREIPQSITWPQERPGLRNALLTDRGVDEFLVPTVVRL